MPIYEYACPDCGHRFEVMQKFSDDPVKDCPSCSAGNVKKLISQSAFVLKGGGWYKDHYGLKSSSDSSSSKGTESAASSSTPAPAASTPAAPASGSSTSGSSSAAPAK